jgi:hypothetical protein
MLIGVTQAVCYFTLKLRGAVMVAFGSTGIASVAAISVQLVDTQGFMIDIVRLVAAITAQVLIRSQRINGNRVRFIVTPSNSIVFGM